MKKAACIMARANSAWSVSFGSDLQAILGNVYQAIFPPPPFPSFSSSSFFRLFLLIIIVALDAKSVCTFFYIACISILFKGGERDKATGLLVLLNLYSSEDFGHPFLDSTWLWGCLKIGGTKVRSRNTKYRLHIPFMVDQFQPLMDGSYGTD